MTRKELITEIALQTGLASEDVDNAVKSFVDVVTEELRKGGKVQMVGFGTFDTVEHPAGETRNIRTGEVIRYESSVLPRFKATKAWKDRVNAEE